MSQSIALLPNCQNLHIDFYDGTRVATWVRGHAGIVLWVRGKAGRSLAGWQAFGNWSGAPEGADRTYHCDDRLRIKTNPRQDSDGMSAALGLASIRDVLRTPGKVVRLVGLSGVGKTRLLEALFDAGVGSASLHPALAVYADMADGPEPSPVALIQEIIANRLPAIFAIDNCPRELHRRVSELCRGSDSMVSAITVEYDIQDDEPEGTEAFELSSSSAEVIETLVKSRFAHLSQVDTHTIAEFADGNARIAIALAGAVERTGTISGLNDEELFQRLFYQRKGLDANLLPIAQACSLVYSFQGEDLSGGPDAELVKLGRIIGKSSQEIYTAVADFRSRGVAQRRSVWRAILPPAIANRLAAQALRRFPSSAIKAELVDGGSERLLKSFSRRLGYLGSSEEAQAIVKSWLAADGWLCSVRGLNSFGRSAFTNAAPAVPEEALTAIEKAFAETGADELLGACSPLENLLRSLAWDSKLFERCIVLIGRLAAASTRKDGAVRAKATFASFFTLYLSGTHASVEQRLAVVEPYILSDDAAERGIGIGALAGLDTNPELQQLALW
jgi:hypothetical protein